MIEFQNLKLFSYTLICIETPLHCAVLNLLCVLLSAGRNKLTFLFQVWKWALILSSHVWVMVLGVAVQPVLWLEHGIVSKVVPFFSVATPALCLTRSGLWILGWIKPISNMQQIQGKLICLILYILIGLLPFFYSLHLTSNSWTTKLIHTKFY